MFGILLLLLFSTRAETTATDAAFAQEMMMYVNQVRTHGCSCAGVPMPAVRPVSWHPKLEITATIHAQQMLKYHFFEHYSKGGLDIGERAAKVGYPWQTIGENLARGQSNVPAVVQAWVKSPEHCRVLMNPKFKEMGAAHEGAYWVLHLGTRKP